MNNGLDISELVTTRISHDIIGNIGAVANAVELLEEGDMDFLDDIRSILKTSSTVLAARLKFFRMAFGLSNANLDDVRLVEATIRDYLKTIGNQNFPIEAEFGAFSGSQARILMLSFMVLADVIIKGGKICSAIEGDKLYVWIAGEAKLAEGKVADMKRLLAGEECLSAQLAPLYCLRAYLAANGRVLHLSDENGLGLTVE